MSMPFSSILDWFGTAWTWVSGMFGMLWNMYEKMIGIRFSLLWAAAFAAFGLVYQFIVYLGGLISDLLAAQHAVVVSTPSVTGASGDWSGWWSLIGHLIAFDIMLSQAALLVSLFAAVFIYRLIKSWVPTVSS